MTNERGTGRGTDAAKQEASAVASAARDETHNVKETAREEVQHVTETARSQAGEIVGEAKDKARDIAGDLRDEARRRADEQGARAADALHDASRQLRAMAQGEPASGMLVDVAQQAAQRVDGFASRLESGGFESIVDDVRSYARRKPGTFLLAAGAAGFIIGRLARNASSVTGSGASGTSPRIEQPPLPVAEAMGASPYAAGVPEPVDVPYYGGATPPAEAGTWSSR
jgi:hypothetical protein